MIIHVMQESCNISVKCQNRIDLAFVVDVSSSICGKTKCNYWNSNIAFIRSIIDSLVIGPFASQVAVITFANYAQVTFYLNT